MYTTNGVGTARWPSLCWREPASIMKRLISTATRRPLATVLEVNGGYRTVPTILFPDGRVLVEPSRRELLAALGLAADLTFLDRVADMLHPRRSTGD